MMPTESIDIPAPVEVRRLSSVRCAQCAQSDGDGDPDWHYFESDW
jgi:hypothetical protein